MPRDTRAGIIPDQQGLHQILCRKTGEAGGPVSNWKDPVWQRTYRLEGAMVEVVAPAIGRGEPLAQPALEAEGSKIGRFYPADQLSFLAFRQELIVLPASLKPGAEQKDRAATWTASFPASSNGAHIPRDRPLRSVQTAARPSDLRQLRDMVYRQCLSRFSVPSIAAPGIQD